MKIPNDNFCISEDGTIIIKDAIFYIIVDGKKFYLTNILEENQELKKQLEDFKINQNNNPFENIKYRNTGFMEGVEATETKYINQQKEFIEYLESEIKYLKIVPLGCKTGYLDGKEHAYIEILSKYKEIIGGKNEDI